MATDFENRASASRPWMACNDGPGYPIHKPDDYDCDGEIRIFMGTWFCCRCGKLDALTMDESGEYDERLRRSYGV